MKRIILFVFCCGRETHFDVYPKVNISLITQNRWCIIRLGQRLSTNCMSGSMGYVVYVNVECCECCFTRECSCTQIYINSHIFHLLIVQISQKWGQFGNKISDGIEFYLPSIEWIVSWSSSVHTNEEYLQLFPRIFNIKELLLTVISSWK